ncbi:hypothetical protein [Actinoplanes sp. NPDC020271]|uniref:hypothetical protein n=1 Tax=Actinoplanes sp. NPDC020271 TaxID=3363896 RepID=UPI00378C805B
MRADGNVDEFRTEVSMRYRWRSVVFYGVASGLLVAIVGYLLLGDFHGQRDIEAVAGPMMMAFDPIMLTGLLLLPRGEGGPSRRKLLVDVGDVVVRIRPAIGIALVAPLSPVAVRS